MTPPPDGLPARRVALEILSAVLDRRLPLDEALDRTADFPRLPPRDRGFVRLLVATVLRRLPEIEALLAGFLAKPLPPRAGRVPLVLAQGAAQLLFLGTPPHAAVSTAVALLTPREVGFKGLVNAVLRRVAQAEPLPPDEAARLDTPDWLFESWSEAYGPETALAIARQHLAEPPLDLTVRDPATAAHWAAELPAALLPNGSLRLGGGAGDVTRLPGFAEGAWWVQDAAAALPARLLGPVAGLEVADLCAAPGGKTLQLAAAGATVLSLDQSRSRLQRVAENLKRTGLAAELVAADLRDWTSERRFDAVLLDAPCSATGTLRRHPDLARHKGPEDVASLAALQARLLPAAAALVRPGGRLVYAVCSLQPEEGPAQVEAFLTGNPAFRRLPLAPAELEGLEDLITPAGDLRSLPCHLAERGGLDGFFAARLERIVT